jgi:hypothetical protein
VDLVSFWQETVLGEADESAEGPQASVSSSVIEAANNAITHGVSLSKLSQVVVDVEAGSCGEESQLAEDALNIAWRDTFGCEHTLLVFSDGGSRDTKFSDALFASSDEIFASFHEVVS